MVAACAPIFTLCVQAPAALLRLTKLATAVAERSSLQSVYARTFQPVKPATISNLKPVSGSGGPPREWP